MFMMAPPRVVSRVVIIVAMEEEAAPMIPKLGLKLAEGIPGMPTQIHEGTYNGHVVAIVHPGKHNGTNLVGTDFAAWTTHLVIQHLRPDLLINAGTCGGFVRAGGAIGDVYCVDAFQHHDRRIPIPGYDALGVGHRKAHATPRLVAALQLKTGLCSTGNSLDCTDLDGATMAAVNAVAKDMEAASIAAIAEMCGNVPLIGIKVVTDLVDGGKPTQDEFLANLAKASKSLHEVVPKVLDFALGKHLRDL